VCLTPRQQEHCDEGGKKGENNGYDQLGGPIKDNSTEGKVENVQISGWPEGVFTLT